MIYIKAYIRYTCGLSENLFYHWQTEEQHTRRVYSDDAISVLKGWKK